MSGLEDIIRGPQRGYCKKTAMKETLRVVHTDHLKQEKLDPLKANNSGILGQTYSEDLQAVWVKETSFMRQTGDPRPTEGLIQ